MGTQNAPTTGIYTKVSVVPYRPSNKENFHIFIKGLAKNTFTNMLTRLKATSLQISQKFFKRTTLTGGIVTHLYYKVKSNLLISNVRFP